MLTSLALQGEVKGGLHFQGSWYLVSWCQASVQVLLGLLPTDWNFSLSKCGSKKLCPRQAFLLQSLGW